MLIYTPRNKDIVKILLSAPLFIGFMHISTIESLSLLDNGLKILLLTFLVMYIHVIRPRKIKPGYYILGILLFFKGILILATKESYYTKALSMSAVDLLLPALILFLSRYYSHFKIEKMFFYLCSLLIIATVPYHLGILTNSLTMSNQKYNLIKYAAEGFLFTGPFANIHNASIVLSFALVGILWKYKKTNQIIVNFFIVLLALIAFYGIFKTYVRTAFLILVLAVVTKLFLSKKIIFSFKNISIVFLLLGLSFWLYNNSTILQMRLNNTNTYGEAGLSYGSGRLVFWSVMLEHAFNNGFFQLFLGIGREASMDHMESVIGKKLFSHNGFIDSLVSNGLIGLVLLIALISQLTKRIFYYRSRDRGIFIFSLVFLLFYLTAITFQSHQIFWMAILISFVFARTQKEVIHIRPKPSNSTIIN